MTPNFDALSRRVSEIAGSQTAFWLAILVIATWAGTGPIFHFSDTWQLVVNTGTTIITFLMVFLIQATQNRDTEALHAKLDELIRSSQARDEFIGIEKKPKRPS